MPILAARVRPVWGSAVFSGAALDDVAGADETVLLAELLDLVDAAVVEVVAGALIDVEVASVVLIEVVLGTVVVLVTTGRVGLEVVEGIEVVGGLEDVVVVEAGGGIEVVLGVAAAAAGGKVAAERACQILTIKS
jgi:hypothetical protein